LSLVRKAWEILFNVLAGVFAFHDRTVEFFEKVERGVEGFLSNAVGSLPLIIEFEVSAFCLWEHLGSENEDEVAGVNLFVART
jgi:hypothetical protein